jgi:hypothetical protein
MGKTYVQGEVLNAADLNASFLELKTLPINPQTATYTLVLADLGTVISATGSVDIPASVFASGSTVSIFNNSTGVINIVQAAGLTLYNASTSVAGSFTLNSRGICSVIFVSPTVAVLTGVGVSVTASGTLQGPIGPAGSITTISAGSAAAPAITPSTDTNTGMFFPAADTIAFAEGGAEAMRIDSNSRVNIGTTSSASGAKLAVVGGPIQLSGSTSAAAGLRVQSISGFAHLSGINSDNNAFNPIAFYTSATEAMRIDSNANLLIGKTSVLNTVAGSLISSGGAATFTTDSASPADGPSLQLVNINASVVNGYRFASFRVNAGATEIGTITKASATTVAYNTSSDYRLKENVQPMQNALAVISALKPSTYNWIGHSESGEGFIAHELQEIIPIAVTGVKDAVNEDGSIKPQGVDYSKIVVHLVAAIQEQQAMITALTNRITALEVTP